MNTYLPAPNSACYFQCELYLASQTRILMKSKTLNTDLQTQCDRTPQAQKVTLIIEPGLDQFETVYRLWYRVWCHHLDGKGYDKKLEDKGGPKILMVHSRKKA